MRREAEREVGGYGEQVFAFAGRKMAWFGASNSGQFDKVQSQPPKSATLSMRRGILAGRHADSLLLPP